MRSEIVENFRDRLKEYIVKLYKEEGLGLANNYSIITVNYYAAYLTSEFVDTLTPEELINSFPTFLYLGLTTNYSGCVTVEDLIKKALVDLHYHYAVEVINGLGDGGND